MVTANRSNVNFIDAWILRWIKQANLPRSPRFHIHIRSGVFPFTHLNDDEVWKKLVVGLFDLCNGFAQMRSNLPTRVNKSTALNYWATL